MAYDHEDRGAGIGVGTPVSQEIKMEHAELATPKAIKGKE